MKATMDQVRAAVNKWQYPLETDENGKVTKSIPGGDFTITPGDWEIDRDGCVRVSLTCGGIYTKQTIQVKKAVAEGDKK